MNPLRSFVLLPVLLPVLLTALLLGWPCLPARADAFAHAILEGQPPALHSAASRDPGFVLGVGDALTWSADPKGGDMAFAYLPGELDSMGTVGRSDSHPAMVSYDSTQLFYQASAAPAEGGRYAIGPDLGGAAQSGQRSVADPAGLAVLGLVLLLLRRLAGLDGRQRRRRQRGGAMAVSL